MTAPTPYDGLNVTAKEAAPPAASPARVVSVRALVDALSMWLVVAGLALLVAAAALAGGTVPALAAGGGGLVAVGLLLTL